MESAINSPDNLWMSALSMLPLQHIEVHTVIKLTLSKRLHDMHIYIICVGLNMCFFPLYSTPSLLRLLLRVSAAYNLQLV